MVKRNTSNIFQFENSIYYVFIYFIYQLIHFFFTSLFNLFINSLFYLKILLKNVNFIYLFYLFIVY